MGAQEHGGTGGRGKQKYRPSFVLLQKLSSSLSLSSSPSLSLSLLISRRLAMCASNHGAGLGIPPAADCTATTDSLITAASRYLARSLACHRIATYLIDRRRRRQLPFTEGLSEFQTETRSLRCYHAATTSKFRMKLIGIHGAGRRNTPCHRLPSLPSLPCDRRRPSERERVGSRRLPASQAGLALAPPSL